MSRAEMYHELCLLGTIDDALAFWAKITTNFNILPESLELPLVVVPMGSGP